MDLWLSPSLPYDEVSQFLQPYEDIDYYPVSTVVGNVRNDSVDCVLPAAMVKEEAKYTPKSPPKAITTFFKAEDTKEAKVKTQKGQSAGNPQRPLKKEKEESTPASDEPILSDYSDFDDVEVLEETTTEKRRQKRKERAAKFSSSTNSSICVDLDESDEIILFAGHKSRKRVKSEGSAILIGE